VVVGDTVSKIVVVESETDIVVVSSTSVDVIIVPELVTIAGSDVVAVESSVDGVAELMTGGGEVPRSVAVDNVFTTFAAPARVAEAGLAVGAVIERTEAAAELELSTSVYDILESAGRAAA